MSDLDTVASADLQPDSTSKDANPIQQQVLLPPVGGSNAKDVVSASPQRRNPRRRINKRVISNFDHVNQPAAGPKDLISGVAAQPTPKKKANKAKGEAKPPSPPLNDAPTPKKKKKAKKAKGKATPQPPPPESTPLLELWQALCLEFGLAQDPNDSTAHPDLPPLPPSKTKASALLKAKAHVNIVDYYFGHSKITTQPVPWGHFKHLVFPTANAMAKYTREAAVAERKRPRDIAKVGECNGMSKEKIRQLVQDGSKVCPKGLAKSAGLQPLMRFIFGRARF